MAHPYPPHHDKLPYVGKHHYFLTFCTSRRKRFFVDATKVDLVRTHILRGARECQFALIAYCFMPDHMHLIASGTARTPTSRS